MQDIKWDTLKFEFMATRSNIRFHYANGAWDEGRLTGDFCRNVSGITSLKTTCTKPWKFSEKSKVLTGVPAKTMT